MYERNTSMVHYQYLHHHNPCVQTPLYLRSAAQVWFPQIARKDQFISANSGLKFEADTLTTSRLIYLSKYDRTLVDLQRKHGACLDIIAKYLGLIRMDLEPWRCTKSNYDVGDTRWALRM